MYDNLVEFLGRDLPLARGLHLVEVSPTSESLGG